MKQLSQTSLDSSNSYAKIIVQAENILSTQYGRPLSLDNIIPIQVEGRFLILRGTVAPWANNISKSVVIKQMSASLTGDRRQETIQASRNEQAILQLLTEVSGTNRYAPRYYASAHLTGTLILEDLGTYPTLQDVLYGQDAQQAGAALVQYGRYLAHMQLAARGQADKYRANLQRFDTTSQHDVLGWDLRNYLHDLHGCLAAFQITVQDEFDQTIHELARSMQEPGPFYTLSHCDAGPHNIMLLPEQPILIDFESACFQHGFVDLVQARMAFPSAGLGRRSSQEVVEQMEKAYRKEVSRGIPEAADDQVFAQALVEACAQVLLTMMAETWRSSSSSLLDTTQSTPEFNFRMQRLITFFHAFLQTAESHQHLSSVRRVVQKIYDNTLSRWPGVEMLAYFPVFQPVRQD